MLTGKQRAKLRAMANGVQATFQIGKGGIGENLLKQLDETLDAREIIKISVLETADVEPQEALDRLCEALRAEPVQTVGRKITLYRRNYDAPKIEI